MVPFCTVIWTCTGPNLVSTALPVYVLATELALDGFDVALGALAEEEPLLEVPDPEVPDPEVAEPVVPEPEVLGPVVLIAAGTLAAVELCVLKLNSITSPVIVLKSASATRRMRDVLN
jgi:hypothetical protein